MHIPCCYCKGRSVCTFHVVTVKERKSVCTFHVITAKERKSVCTFHVVTVKERVCAHSMLLL